MLDSRTVERADLYLKTGKRRIWRWPTRSEDLRACASTPARQAVLGVHGPRIGSTGALSAGDGSDFGGAGHGGEAAINLAKTLGDDHPDTQWARRAARL